MPGQASYGPQGSRRQQQGASAAGNNFVPDIEQPSVGYGIPQGNVLSFNGGNNNGFGGNGFGGNNGGVLSAQGQLGNGFGGNDNGIDSGDLDASSDEMNLKMLMSAVPGTPGQDYPIYSQVPDTDFDCNGRVFGGEIYT